MFPSFSIPALAIAGLIATAAPILIHILNKRRFKRVDWAAMEFLRRAYKVRRRRVKLEELLLLAMRCLIVALFGAALAQPFFNQGAAGGSLGDARTDRIIVLDDSLSMKARSGISSPAEEASKLLRNWISDLATSDSADSITILRTSNPAEPLFNGVPLTEDVTSQILEELKDLLPAPSAGNLASAMLEVEKILGDGTERAVNQSVYVITDMRAKDWASAKEPGIDSTLLESIQRISEKANGAWVIDLAGEQRGNLAIEAIAPADVALVAGTMSRFSVVVRNYSEREVSGAKVSLAAGTGAPQTADLEPIPAKGTGTATFNVALPDAPAGPEGAETVVLPPVPLHARISGTSDDTTDALPDDDERYFPVRLSSGIRVLVVDGDPSGTFGQSETYFLTRALAPRGNTRSGVSTTVVDESEFSTLELDPFQVIYLCNVYAIPDDRRIALENWVRGGGGLVVSLGDQIDQNDWNDKLFRNGQGLLPVRLESVEGDETEQTWTYFDPQNAQHAIFKVFEGGQNPLRSNVKVFQWWKTSLPPEPTATTDEEAPAVTAVLANFSTDDKSPAIVERPFGKGNVLAITTSMDVDWSNWPLDISYLVVMQEITRHVAQSNVREGEIGVGSAISQNVDLSRFRPDVIVTEPSAESRTVQARPAEGSGTGATNWVAEFTDTATPGFYTVSVRPTDGSAQQDILYAANLELAESDLAIASREAVSRDLAQAGIGYVQSPESFEALDEESEKSGIWRYVLYAVLALMAVELFYGWRIAAQRRAVKPRSFNQGGRSMARAAAIMIATTIATAPDSQVHAQAIIIGGVRVQDPDAPGALQELSGPQLKTNEEIGDILAQADDLVNQKRYELATVLWQKALDTSADTLFTRDDWKVERGDYSYQVYKPVVSEIEATLAQLPPEALKAYQLKADGDAEALLAAATPSERRQVLGEVVSRFFLSSIGDDSAFELACYMLDDMEYFGAARVLRKLLDHHPALTVSRTEILKRLAVAEARSGGPDRAAEVLTDLKNSAGALPRSFIAAVETDIASARSDQLQLAGSNSTAESSVPADFATAPSRFSLAWEQPFTLNLPADWPVIPDPPKRKPGENARPYNYPAAANANLTDIGLRNSWKQQHHEPVGQISIDRNNVIFRNEERLAAINASTGEARWLGMRSGSTAPFGLQRDAYFFRDYAAQLSLAWNGTLFTVEGQTLDFAEEELTGVVPVALDPDEQQRMAYGAREMTRARDNRLAAYDIRTGKLLWTRRANEPNISANGTISFSSKPEPAPGGTLAVAVHEGRQVWLVIIDAATGLTKRRTQICQEPAECLSTAAIDVTVTGSDALIATGAGAVACMDTHSGEIRWCTTYTRPISAALRTSVANMNIQVQARQIVNMMNTGQARPDGWNTDTVLVHGGTVILLPSDCDRMLAFSRVSGEFLWEAPKNPDGLGAAASIMGFSSGRIFVRGMDLVRCYEARGGRIAWETKTSPQFGNGLVTAGAIYAPLENAIVRLDAETGKELATISIDGSEEPPGSLFSDGTRLYSMSPGEMRAFEIK
ncbi:MAG: PQQ-binding-like beta-propeller repeat protein [Verrucomicrobiae bacterium]|nr:PQQ-binding-like beta-propeller repeat protein [Verrucomicrobiae bacterium]